MADINVTKLTQIAAIGPTAAEEAVPKLVMYVLLEPGNGSGGPAPVHRSFTYGQRFRNPSDE
jgi:hypothetical protein